MGNNIFSILFAVLVVFVVVQYVSCDENNIPSVHLDADSAISANSAVLSSPARNRLCLVAACYHTCRSLKYKNGYCNRRGHCVCSNRTLLKSLL